MPINLSPESHRASLIITFKRSVTYTQLIDQQTELASLSNLSTEEHILNLTLATVPTLPQPNKSVCHINTYLFCSYATISQDGKSKRGQSVNSR